MRYIVPFKEFLFEENCYECNKSKKEEDLEEEFEETQDDELEKEESCEDEIEEEKYYEEE